MIGKCWFAALLLAVPAYSQSEDKVVVPFSDSSRAGVLKVSLVNGSIHVTGYDGKSVVVEVQGAAGRQRQPEPPRADGLRRIDLSGSSIRVEEQENTVRVTAPPGRNVELHIQVPTATSLQLRGVNGGLILVEHVSGELDIDTVNTGVRLSNVSGAVVAHALNKDVVVQLDRVANAPMSFSSLNGNVDVTLPASVKARVKLKSQNSPIYSDFAIQTDSGTPAGAGEGRPGRGKYQIQFERTLQGSINGGGPEMTFTTLNGKIYLRKKD